MPYHLSNVMLFLGDPIIHNVEYDIPFHVWCVFLKEYSRNLVPPDLKSCTIEDVLPRDLKAMQLQ